MKSRSMVVVLALLLAVGATAAVFLYVNAVKKDARTGGELVSVVVSNQAITAGTFLTPLIGENVFEELSVPKDAVVADAVTDISQLRGRTTTAAIIANEQIPLSRLSGGEGLPGGTLGIPDGYEALTVALDAPAAVIGAFAAGDYLTVYATFTNAPVKQKGQPPPTTPGQQQPTTATVVLVPQVQVLRVALAQNQSENAQVGQASGTITIALALTPEDAQKFVFSVDQGTVYLGLLPPNGQGTELPPLTVADIVAGAKKAK